MASTVLVRDVLSRVAVLLQDTSPQFQRWPEHELVDWLNDAQTAITKFLPAACSRVDAVKLKAGTRQSIESIAAGDCKPGDGSTPAAAILGTQLLDMIRNMGADGLTPGKSIRVVDRKILDSQTPTWHTAPNALGSISSFTYDPRTPRYFFVTPPASTNPVVWVEIAYTAQPIKIPNTGTLGNELYKSDGTGSGANTTISIADEFTDDLANYVVARANMKEIAGADSNMAALYANLFTSSLNAKVSAITGNSPGLARLPLAPEPLGAAK